MFGVVFELAGLISSPILHWLYKALGIRHFIGHFCRLRKIKHVNKILGNMEFLSQEIQRENTCKITI